MNIKKRQAFVKLENRKINISKLFLNYEPNFLNINNINKYKDICDKALYNCIIKKQYTDILKRNLKWELNFDFLHEESPGFNGS